MGDVSARRRVPMDDALASYFRYLPISPIDRDWGLYVAGAGHAHVAPHSTYPPPGHPREYHFSWKNGRVLHEFQVVYITRGGGVFESDATDAQQLVAGDVILLFPDVWHRYAPNPPSGWDEHWVCFDGDQARSLLKKGFFSSRRPVVHIGMDKLMLDAYDHVVEQMRLEPLGYQQVIAAATMGMLARILAAARARNAGGSHVEAIIREARRRIAESLDRDIDVEQMADELHIGYSWFRQMFKRYTGLSPHQYHLQSRLNKGRQLLSATNYTVKEVAAELGFHDPHYFCRLFRKKTGQSPGDWRRHLKTQPCSRRRSH